jgi:hypothetical protein
MGCVYNVLPAAERYEGCGTTEGRDERSKVDAVSERGRLGGGTVDDVGLD